MAEKNNISEEREHKRTRLAAGMFEGPVVPLIIRLAVPMFLGMAVQLLYNVVDTLWISRIDMNDPSLVGGSGMVFPIIFLAMAIANGLAVGVSSLVARAIGEKNHDILNKTAETGLFMAAIASAVLIIVFYIFTDDMIRLLGASGDYFLHAREYMLYIIPAGVVVFVMNVFIGILQGEGQMKYVMVAMFIGTFGNIILDPVFIFVLDMGIRGAALATTIAQAISCVYLLIFFLRGGSTIRIELHIRNVSRKVMGQITAIGLPQALGMILMAFSFLVYNRVVIFIDPNAMTAMTLTGRIEQAVLMPIFAVSSALVTLVGQNAGRGLLDRVKEFWIAGIKLAVVVVFFMATLLFLTAPFIYRAFSEVPEVQHYAVLQTRIVIYTFMCASVGILAGSVFQGLGYPIQSMMMMIMRIFGFSVPFVLLFVYVLKLGMYGVWFGFIIGNVTGGLLGYFWTHSILGKLKAGILKVRTTMA
ncbi:MAG: MATE family efflux transporter [Spirochaetales bacterium]|nr:MATE family efflux transporter [Spirochaetales bacterium]